MDSSVGETAGMHLNSAFRGQENAPVSVLLVEDSAAEVRRLVMHLEEMGLHEQLTVVPDGKSAKAYLSKVMTGEVPLPGIVALDLGLPDMSGHDLLRWIRQQSSFRCLPVVVVTVSTSEGDRRLSEQFGANAHLVKPVIPSQLVSAIDLPLINLLDAFCVRLVHHAAEESNFSDPALDEAVLRGPVQPTVFQGAHLGLTAPAETLSPSAESGNASSPRRVSPGGAANTAAKRAAHPTAKAVDAASSARVERTPRGGYEQSRRFES